MDKITLKTLHKATAQQVFAQRPGSSDAAKRRSRGTASWAGRKGMTTDKYLVHEAMDRASRLVQHVDTDLLEHGWARRDPEFRKHVERALKHLYAAYQCAGKHRFADAKPNCVYRASNGDKCAH